MIPSLCLLPVLYASSTMALPAPAASLPSSAVISDAVKEASRRYGIPEMWIRAVMGVESSGNLRAISPKGALGLMQLMPATWLDMRTRHGLGDDVFDPRDNILAGTAYLRLLYDRYGKDGFIAAYNAGPGRYEAHLNRGKPLPEETRLYVSHVYEHLGLDLGPDLALPARHIETARPFDWRQAPLFSQSIAPADALPEQAARPGSTPFVMSQSASSAPSP